MYWLAALAVWPESSAASACCTKWSAKLYQAVYQLSLSPGVICDAMYKHSPTLAMPASHFPTLRCNWPSKFSSEKNNFTTGLPERWTGIIVTRTLHPSWMQSGLHRQRSTLLPASRNLGKHGSQALG